MLAIILDILPTLVISLLIYFAAFKVFRIYPRLYQLNIPVAVVGGLIFAGIFSITEIILPVEINFPNYLRDILLVIFFSVIGLSVRFREIISGGKPLLNLCFLAILLVVLQNFFAVLLATSAGLHPLYGLMAGSVSFVGGFGSSLAWGNEFASKGLDSALEVGFACSTLGLIAGGLLAGPLATLLIKRYQLKLPSNAASIVALETKSKSLSLAGIVLIALLIIASILIADLALPYLKAIGLAFPRFLIAMIVAIVITNFIPQRFENVTNSALDFIGDWAFSLFIIVALVTMNFSGLAHEVLPLTIILFVQIIVSLLFAFFVIFRVMGKNYEAAVLSGGVVGFGLSSLAVAMATVKTIIRRHGPAPQALALTALVGAALIDFANSMIIIVLSNLPWFAIP